MDYQKILDDIAAELEDYDREGHLPDYIPELQQVKADAFGMVLCTLDGQSYHTGDSDHPFSIQSISKVLSLTLAFQRAGESIWKRVGVEPSGHPFNSLGQLEYENGIPRNPLINAGALVIADILVSRLDRPLDDFLAFVRKAAGTEAIDYNHAVAESERQYGDRNAALVHLLKSFGNIQNEVSEVLEFYYHQCAIDMSCRQLARTFLLYANHGKFSGSGDEIINFSRSKRINAVMQTCGFYDEAGEFTFKVGLPGKSGVGGGIAAIHPGRYSVAVWSPLLNAKGNSYKGMKALEWLTTRTGFSIF